jgi:dephospho-CoA kinase
MTEKKLIVGLTGGFGTGKSTVAKMFREWGARVLHADEIAHEALVKGSACYGKISAFFPDAETSAGILDRKKIADVVFKDAEKRKALEDIVHAYVYERIQDEVDEASESLVVLDVPLLFETGYAQNCHKTVVVSAAPEVSAERLRAKGFSSEEIEKRRQAQMPLAEKEKKADYIIHNSGSLEQTRREAEKVWKTLRPAPKGEQESNA